MPFCQKCGNEVTVGAAFCSVCGSKIGTLTQAERSILTEASSANGEYLKVFVGKNFEYYKKKWEISEQKKTNISWNWAAFFFGFLWLAYRKMYLYSWIFIGIIAFETACELAFTIPDNMANALSSVIGIGGGIIFGCYGSYWYKIHVEKKIIEIRSVNSSDTNIELARRGGTSIAATIGFFVAFFGILVLLEVIAGGLG